MKLGYRIGMHLLGLLIVILASIYTVDLLYLTRIPAVAPFGFGMLVFFILLDAVLVVLEGKTPQVITNVGHWSINATKDMFDIPWQVNINDELSKNINLQSMRIMFPGGINACGLSTHSSPEKPVLIAPSIYFHKEEKNYVGFANFENYELAELPPYLQYVLKRFFPHRVKEKKPTPIYYSEVSHMDGSATPENMRILGLQREQNKEDSVISTRIIRLYDELERGNQSKNKIFVKKELEEVIDANE